MTTGTKMTTETNIRIAIYRPDHFMAIRNSSVYFTQLHLFYDIKSPKHLAQIYLRGPAYTLFSPNHEIIGCGGVIKLWKDVGDAWVLATPLVQRYPKTVFKAVKFFLRDIIDNLHLVRVQCIVQKNSEVGHRFVKHLGFKEEGPLEKYFGGMDFIRYAIITEFGEKYDK